MSNLIYTWAGIYYSGSIYTPIKNCFNDPSFKLGLEQTRDILGLGYNLKAHMKPRKVKVLFGDINVTSDNLIIKRETNDGVTTTWSSSNLSSIP